MIAGLPLSTWLLIVVATVPALVMATAAYRVHGRHDDGSIPSPRPPDASTPASTPDDADPCD